MTTATCFFIGHIFLSMSGLKSSETYTWQKIEFEQNDRHDSEIFLNNTRKIIFAVKKRETSGNLPESEKIKIAAKLSDHAKTLWDSGNYDEAVKCDSKSRTLALEMLEQYTTADYIVNYRDRSDERTEYLESIISQDNTTLDYWKNQLN